MKIDKPHDQTMVPAPWPAAEPKPPPRWSAATGTSLQRCNFRECLWPIEICPAVMVERKSCEVTEFGSKTGEGNNWLSRHVLRRQHQTKAEKRQVWRLK